MKSKVLYSYYDNGVKIDVYAPRKPRPEEVTWSASRMRGSIFNNGRKQESMKEQGYRSYASSR